MNENMRCWLADEIIISPHGYIYDYMTRENIFSIYYDEKWLGDTNKYSKLIVFSLWVFFDRGFLIFVSAEWIKWDF